MSQGRDTFERVRADPDSLAGLAWSDDGEDFGDAEDLAYLVVDILEKRGVDLKGPPGEDAPSFDPSEPTGEPFSEDDDEWFEATFPRLWARTESIRAVVGEVDYDPDVSEMSRGDLSGGHYTGLMVRSSLDPNVLARFRAGGHKVLCWMPRDGEIDSAELLPLAEELKALTFLAPECRDDSVLASLTGLRMLESRTSADNALDLSGLGELYDLRINDRPGLAGLDQVPLYFLSLTDTRRALAEFEGMAGLRELVVDGARDARIDLGAHLPQLEVLVIDAPRIGSLADLDASSLRQLTIRTRDAATVDVSPLAGCHDLDGLTAEGPVTLTGISQLAHIPNVRLRLRDGARLDPSTGHTLPATWKR